MINAQREAGRGTWGKCESEKKKENAKLRRDCEGVTQRGSKHEGKLFLKREHNGGRRVE